MVRRCPSCTASMAAMRPLIAAEPMLRAPRPEMVAESTLTGPDDCGLAGCGVCARTATPAASATPRSVDESQRGGDESRRVIIVFISRESFCQSPFFASSVLLSFRRVGRLPSARRLLGGLLGGRLRGLRLLGRRGRGVGRARRLRLRRGLEEAAFVNRDVGLDLLVCDLLLVLAALRPGLDGEGKVPAVDLLVVAEERLRLLLLAADGALGLDLDGHEVVRVHVVDEHVAVGARHLELVGVAALELVLADVLDLDPLLFVVDERPVEV